MDGLKGLFFVMIFWELKKKRHVFMIPELHNCCAEHGYLKVSLLPVLLQLSNVVFHPVDHHVFLVYIMLSVVHS